MVNTELAVVGGTDLRGDTLKEAANRGGCGVPPLYRAGYLGGLWGIIGPKGFVACSGWTYAEVAGRARLMNGVLAAIEARDEELGA
jgi:hypothetical protein